MGIEQQLYQDQIQQELEKQEQDKKAAIRVIKAHGKANRWKRSEICRLIEMLGLEEEPRLSPTRLTAFNSPTRG